MTWGKIRIQWKESDMDKKRSMEEVALFIKENDGFTITAHVNPEGDSVGSQIALYLLLKKLGKRACMINHDRVPENLSFLKASKDISSAEAMPEGKNVIVLDCPVMERIGDVKGCLGNDIYIVNIDHHISNTEFGDINWVDPSVSSAGEMIYLLAGELHVAIDADIAEAIYTAIVVDTGRFSYSNTTARTHAITASLMECGASPSRIYQNIFENKDPLEIRLLASVLSTLKLEDKGKVAHITISPDIYPDDIEVSTENLVNYARSIKGVEVAVFFKVRPGAQGTVNVSFRSKGFVDVNELASKFGGGGHPAAAGCTVEGELSYVKDRVLKTISEALKG